MKEIKSPLEVWVEAIVPEGNSMQNLADGYIPLKRQGFKFETVLTIVFCLFTNITSIAKRIKKVWIELQGLIINASVGLSSFLPINPLILLKGVLAMSTSLARVLFLVLLIKAMIYRV